MKNQWLRIITAIFIWIVVWFVNQFVPNQAEIMNTNQSIAYIVQQTVVSIIASVVVLVVGRSPVLNILLSLILIIAPMVYMRDLFLSGDAIFIWYGFFIPVIVVNTVIIGVYIKFFHKKRV